MTDAPVKVRWYDSPAALPARGQGGGALGSLVRLLVPGGPLYTNALVSALAANSEKRPADLRPTVRPCIGGFRGGATFGLGLRF